MTDGGSRVTPPFQYAVAVRFRDLDALGHAHHALPLMYVEEARAQLWRELTGESGIEGIDYVMGSVALRYHAPIFYPSRVQVELNVTHIGDKSFELGFGIRSEAGVLLVSGTTVQVMYDYETRTSKPIDPDLRRNLEAMAGSAPEHESDGGRGQPDESA